MVRYKAPVIEVTQQPSANAESGVAFDQQPAVTITDGDGSPVVGEDVTVSLFSGTGTLNGTLTVATNGSGVAQFSGLSINGDEGNYSLAFSVENNSEIVISNLIVIGLSADADQSTITAAPTVIEANGVSTSNITVQLKNAAGIDLTSGGDTVVLSTNAGSLSSVTDNEDGTYTAILTSSTDVETATITGTLNGDPITDSATVNFTVGAASALQSTISASPTSLTADGSSTSTITVQVKDGAGNDITSGGDTVVLSSNLGSIGSVTDNSNGTYTATLTAGTVAGPATVTATLNGDLMENSVVVTLLPGPLSAAQTLITASPSAIIANGSSQSLITVQAADANGNFLISGGETVTLSLSPDEGSLGSITDNGDGTYTAMLTSSTTPQTVIISGTIDGDAIGDTAEVEYLSGGEEGIVFIQGDGGEVSLLEENGDTYYVHVFNNTGTSSFMPPVSVEAIDFLLVGGGGGGGTSMDFSNGGAGGGGAGGVLFAEDFDISAFATPISILVGAGGAPGAAGDNNSGFNGQNTVFGDGDTSPVTALGGGFGIGGNPQNDIQPAGEGGSGGGGRGVGSAGEVTSQTLPSGVIAYGNTGGETPNAGTGAGAGGGGGAGTAGSDGEGGNQSDPPQGFGGNGGDGIEISISGAALFYGGGGGGGAGQTGTPGTGGQGGGGTGANDNQAAVAGAANSGGGGGGGNNNRQGAAGGSGTVVVRYLAPSLAITTQPTAQVQSGQVFAQQPLLTLLDGSGTGISGVDVTVFLVSGSASLGGTLTISTNSSGEAQFTDLTLTGSNGFNVLGFSITGSSNFVISNSVEISGEAPFYSRATGNWDVASNWSRESYNGVASLETPGSSDQIFIGGGHTITLNFGTFTLNDPGSLTVEDTGTLALSGGNHITGTGTFALESGGTLRIGSANGITASGSTGNIRTTTRTFDQGANYTYNGASAQNTGSGLPQQVNDLRINNASGVRAEISHQVNGTLFLQAGRLIMGNGLSLIANDKDITSGELQSELQIGGQAGYRLLSSPLSASYSNFLSGVITQGFPGASLTDTDPLQPNVLWYNETVVGTDNQRWRAPADASNTVMQGRGYFVYMFGDVDGDNRYNDEFPYLLTVNGQEHEGTGGVVDLNVTYTAAADSGWNLVGNPFAAAIDWEEDTHWAKTNIDPTIYIWDPNTNNYLTWNGTTGDVTNGILAPFQGFWVKANDTNPTLTVSREAKTLTEGAGFIGKVAEKESERDPVPVISIQARNTEYLRSTVHFSFTGEGRLGIDRYDAERLLPPTEVETFMEFYSLTESKRLAINNLPERFGRVIEIPLELNAYTEGEPLTGEVRLHVSSFDHIPEEWEVELIDLQSGERHRVVKGLAVRVPMVHLAGKELERTNASGKLTAKGGNAHARFVLRIAPSSDLMSLSQEFVLHPNYPNPFNPSTTLAFDLPLPGPVRLEVYDMIGRRVAVLVHEDLPAGSHSRVWDAGQLSSGIYLVRMITQEGIVSRKVTLVK